MERLISVVIPNYNGAATIGKCLEAACASDYSNYEIIVVDDCSDDESLNIINKFPVKTVRLDHRSGTSKARNSGAENSSGEIIFFTDADCLPQKNTLSKINELFPESSDVILGGTYAKMPFDDRFFSMFQALFVHFFETKCVDKPDYIAAHAMIMSKDTFMKSSGFPVKFMPIIEDVEYSHRLKRAGVQLRMAPEIQVAHIFDFTLWRSLRNAYRKSKYWNMYSLRNKDFFADSGTASYELKTNVASFVFSCMLVVLWAITGNNAFLAAAAGLTGLNFYVNRLLFKDFIQSGGAVFGGCAALYYSLLYPIPIGMATISALFNHFSGKGSP